MANPFSVGINLDPIGALMGWFGNERQISSAKDINQKASDWAQYQQKMQIHMASTTYSRAVEDLKRAGLNPMLAVTSGMSSPSTGIVPRDLKNPAGNTAMNLAMANKMGAEVRYLKSQAKLNENQGVISDMMTKFLKKNPWMVNTKATTDNLGGALLTLLGSVVGVGKFGLLSKVIGKGKGVGKAMQLRKFRFK